MGWPRLLVIHAVAALASCSNTSTEPANVTATIDVAKIKTSEDFLSWLQNFGNRTVQKYNERRDVVFKSQGAKKIVANKSQKKYIFSRFTYGEYAGLTFPGSPTCDAELGEILSQRKT